MLAFARRFDPQPFHTDPVAAADSVLGGLCASGWFTCALWMRAYADAVLAGSTSQGSPGGSEIAWPAPVFPGETLRSSVEVVDTRRSSEPAAAGVGDHHGQVRGGRTGRPGRRGGAALHLRRHVRTAATRGPRRDRGVGLRRCRQPGLDARGRRGRGGSGPRPRPRSSPGVATCSAGDWRRTTRTARPWSGSAGRRGRSRWNAGSVRIRRTGRGCGRSGRCVTSGIRPPSRPCARHWSTSPGGCGSTPAPSWRCARFRTRPSRSRADHRPVSRVRQAACKALDGRRGRARGRSGRPRTTTIQRSGCSRTALTNSPAAGPPPHPAL